MSEPWIFDLTSSAYSTIYLKSLSETSKRDWTFLIDGFFSTSLISERILELKIASGYAGNLLHGEAVAIGMVIAIDLSVRMGLCSESDLNKVRNHFREIGLPIGLKEIAAGNWSAEGLIKNMLQDKKAEAGNLAFILSGGIGNSLVSREVSHKDLIEILTCYLDVWKPKIVSGIFIRTFLNDN